jgi:SynChlorMet cassette protein ScmD
VKNGEKPIINPLVVLREEFDDWAVLFDPDTGHAFGLNPTGVYVWKLLDGGHTLDALLQKIRAHADDVPEDLSDHIVLFVDALVAEGLVGFDRTGCGQGKSSSPPPTRASAIEPFTYVPPQLVNLHGEQAAYGANCSNGSQATNTCGTGNLACSCSSGTGRSPACCSGACHNVSCCSGTCDNLCYAGTYPGWSCSCVWGTQAGNCTNGTWAASPNCGYGNMVGT